MTSAAKVLRWSALGLMIAAAWPFVRCGLCRRRVWGPDLRAHVNAHLDERSRRLQALIADGVDPIDALDLIITGRDTPNRP